MLLAESSHEAHCEKEKRVWRQAHPELSQPCLQYEYEHPQVYSEIERE